MRVEFPQGVPEGCIEWLWENVGVGNRMVLTNPLSFSYNGDKPEFDWFYQRIYIMNDVTGERWYVPTITVKDKKSATWFMLRWL